MIEAHGGKVEARVAIRDAEVPPLTGTYDAGSRRLELEGTLGVSADLQLDGDRLRGTARLVGRAIVVDARRVADQAPPEPPVVVDFSVEQPRAVHRSSLAPALAGAVGGAIERVMEAQRVVGLSAALASAK